MIFYFLVGIGFYLGLFVVNIWMFKGASFIAICRGLFFGIFFWPIAALALIIHRE